MMGTETDDAQLQQTNPDTLSQGDLIEEAHEDHTDSGSDLDSVYMGDEENADEDDNDDDEDHNNEDEDVDKEE